MDMEQWMVEAAAAELLTLEADHPGRFDYLKLELRNFITQPSLLFHCPSSPSSSSYCSVPTQASSTRKRKGEMEEGPKVKRRRWPSERSADMAMERAAECLRKIRRVKESLSG